MNRTLLFLAVGVVPIGSTLFAQEPELPAPQEEHRWLKQFVGKWETQAEGSMGPNQPPMKCKGTITARMLGGFWVINEMQTDVMGTPMTGIQTIGYDTGRKKYVGTWVDSMLDHMWKYEGSVDDSGKILTLDAEGPNFMAAGKLTKYRDVYQFKSPDMIITTSQMLGEDGKWITFMTGTAKRTK